MTSVIVRMIWFELSEPVTSKRFHQLFITFLNFLLFVCQCANVSDSGAGCKKLIIVSNVQKSVQLLIWFRSFLFFLYNNLGEGKRILMFVFFVLFILSSVLFSSLYINMYAMTVNGHDYCLSSSVTGWSFKYLEYICRNIVYPGRFIWIEAALN